MAGSGTTKKISINNLLSSSPTATGALTVTGLVTAGSATITGDLTVRTNKLAVTSTGVGFGTTTPTGVADFLSAVIGNSNVLTIGNNEYGAATYLNSNSVSLTFNRGPSFKTGAVVSSNVTSGNLSEGYIAFQTSASNVLTERYRIDNTGISTWSVAGSTAMTLDSTGLGVGVVPTTSARIHTLGNGNNVYAVFQNGDTLATNKTSQLWLSNGPSFLGANNREYRIVNLGTSATDADLVFDYWNGTAIAERMRIDASGNLILLSSNTPATLTTNGQLTVNATSNTNVRFSYRGSDGVTRVGNLALA
jgi:hypothetical protein